MRIAVTGATGYVGRFIVNGLLSRGHDVRAWRRSTSDVGGYIGPVAWVPGELGDGAGDQPLLAGVDALVHAAFDHLPGRYRGGEGEDLAGFLKRNEAGSIRLLEAAARLGVRRVVFLSSRAVYGSRLWDRALDESHPVAPDTHYGAYKHAVELALASLGGSRAWSSLRVTGVFGRGWPLSRSKWYDVVAASRTGQQPSPRGGTEVAGQDVASAVQIMLEAPTSSIAGRVFNVSDVYVTHRAVSRLAGGALAPRSGPAQGVMATSRLQALGWRPGGWAAVERTVRALVRAIEKG